MNDILFELLKLIVMIAVLLVMRYAIPWLRARIGAEKIAEIEKWAKKAVLMAQQVYWNKSGEERKEIVIFKGDADCKKYFDFWRAVGNFDRSSCKTNENRRGQKYCVKTS